MGKKHGTVEYIFYLFPSKLWKIPTGRFLWSFWDFRYTLFFTYEVNSLALGIELLAERWTFLTWTFLLLGTMGFFIHNPKFHYFQGCKIKSRYSLIFTGRNCSLCLVHHDDLLYYSNKCHYTHYTISLFYTYKPYQSWEISSFIFIYIYEHI